MGNRPLKIRLLAAFVIAFVCLNAGGAVCVAYCQSFDTSAVEAAEHCPLKKAASHCDKPEQSNDRRDSIGMATGELDCCPMTVSFFAAPVENNSFSFAATTVAVVSQPTSFDHLSFGADSGNFPPTVTYRGPPKLDRRIFRIQHCLLRI